ATARLDFIGNTLCLLFSTSYTRYHQGVHIKRRKMTKTNAIAHKRNRLLLLNAEKL
ncbi:hypothetical protein L9F63_007487, partial [Diploptera punctata]